jgi:hypothetical protein
MYKRFAIALISILIAAAPAWAQEERREPLATVTTTVTHILRADTLFASYVGSVTRWVDFHIIDQATRITKTGPAGDTVESTGSVTVQVLLNEYDEATDTLKSAWGMAVPDASSVVAVSGIRVTGIIEVSDVWSGSGPRFVTYDVTWAPTPGVLRRNNNSESLQDFIATPATDTESRWLLVTQSMASSGRILDNTLDYGGTNPLTYMVQNDTIVVTSMVE